MATPAADTVLFFIPDLGGFTKFVTQTEIQHSQHIIKELLETLVDANAIDLQVSEFEGDAVLFYRPGSCPTLRELVLQAKAMYLALHGFLKQFELTNVCPCGACSRAPGITLKMVAHFGAAGVMKVKQHSKFIGKDIIVAHRLLKNSVEVVEYLLVTQATLADLAEDDGDLASFATGADTYDELGTIEYYVKALATYRSEVKVGAPSPLRLARPQMTKRLTQRIGAPIEDVAQKLIDLPTRKAWIDGAIGIELPDGHENNFIGTVHRCVRADGVVKLMTSSMAKSDTSFELWETELEKRFALRWLLSRVADRETDFAVEIHTDGGLLSRLRFKGFLERKLAERLTKSAANLAALCEKTAGAGALAQTERWDMETAGAA